MKFRRRLFALVMSVMLLMPALPFGAVAADPPEGMINIPEGSEWQGSVFGDIGGNPTATNFEITEADGTVKLRSSNDKGKIQDDAKQTRNATEGIAYYYQAVPTDADFELSATATVDAWTANGQVSFGIMLRNQVYENVSDAVYSTGEYVAVGALKQVMKGFHKEVDTAGSFDRLVDIGDFFEASKPDVGIKYSLSIKKSGDNYVLKVGDEVKTISNYSGMINYVGLFTARNVTVTYSNIQLTIEEPEEVDLSDWKFVSFGSNTSAAKNPEPTLGSDGSVYLEAKNGGKIASGHEGISFFYQDIPSTMNFEFFTKAKVERFPGDNNEQSFGIMIRDQIGNHRDNSEFTSNFIAVGPVESIKKTGIRPFYRQGATSTAPSSGTRMILDTFDGVNPPSKDEEYDLKIKKIGDAYVITANEKSEVIYTPNQFDQTIYAGLFVSREADITFSNFGIKVDSRKPVGLKIDSLPIKGTYLVDESLDLTGLKVTAIYDGGAEEALTDLDYVVTGFDSSQAGTNQLTVHFNGATATIDLEIIALEVTKLEVLFEPVKTQYYIGDIFDPSGLVVSAEYNDGYKNEILTRDLYELYQENINIDENELEFTSAASKIPITIKSVETPSATVEFFVEVKDAILTELEIHRNPEKVIYYIGDDGSELDLSGLLLYAHYSDGTRVRLMPEEFEVSVLDTSTAGKKHITITHKSLTVELELSVLEVQLVGIEITAYPKTSFVIGESFDHSGLQISKVFNNGHKEVFLNYEIDSTNFDSSQVGTYEIFIRPTDSGLTPISYQVTVREQTEHEWNFIRFGQSTSNANNTITHIDDESFRLVALEGGGKVTGDHDGISFYYTVIDAVEDNFELSADIKVEAYAKTPHDGQESFGIMARDAIDEPNTSNVFASNIAAIGGYSGGTRNPNGTQLFVRTGVESSDGAGSQGIQAIMLHNETPSSSNTPYRLTLAKTNSGFVGKIDDGDSEIIYTPDILNVQDSKIYVGFYAARLATIEVSNIEFKVSSAATDAPRVEPPAEPVTPVFEIMSLEKTPDRNYQLKVKPNVDGAITVKQAQQEIVRYLDIEKGKVTSISAMLETGNNHFSITFIPDDTQLLTSYDKIIKNFTVHVKAYSGDIYVSPDGTPNGLGTQDSPVDLDSAINYVQPGQNIIMLHGTYVRNAPLNIKKYNDGKPEARKTLMAAPGANPIIDFDKKTEGVLLSGNYWHIKGIGFTRSAANTKGFVVGGSHNIVENSQFFENGDTGLQISRTDDSTHIDDWPSHNLILNSTSYFNRDPSNNNADGFAAKLTSGVGNVFRGCIAYNNIDDGWDLYAKAGSGAIGAVLIEDSIAYNNGFVPGVEGTGDGNGFKLGGEGIHVPHVIKNSIAFNNLSYGFTSNSNPGLILEATNVGFNNEGGNLNLSSYAGISLDFKMDGFVSYHNTATAKRDNYPNYLESDSNYLFNGKASSNKLGVVLSNSNFASLSIPKEFKRDETGQIIRGDFLKFIRPDNNDGGDPDDGDNGEDPGDGDNGEDPGDGDNGKDPDGGDKPGEDDGDPDDGDHGEAPDDDNDDGGSDGSSGSDSDATTPEDGRIDVSLELRDGVASGTVDQEQLQAALDKISANEQGIKRVHIVLPQLAGAEAYELTIPAPAVTTAGKQQELAIDSEFASMVLPGDMLSNVNLEEAEEVTLHIASVNVADLPAELAAKIGNRPVVEFNITANGKRVDYNNPDAPVLVSIPYEPTAEELRNAEHITVWYISNDGQVTPVTSGKYNKETGRVTFKATHFSKYAVVFVQKTFGDLASVPWAQRQIEMLASKGVIRGTSETTFAPTREITRADFTLLLVRTFGLTAEAGASFNDVKPSDYYYEELNIAKQLGIAQGRGDGNFYPNERISRQDMFVIAARTLKAMELLEQSNGTADLSRFSDYDHIAAYAANDLASLVHEGLVKGSSNHLRPLDPATRAEAAVFIYSIYQRVE